LGYNTLVHGSNVRNLSIQLSLSQTSKNAMFFLLSLMSSLQQNWRRRQNRLCMEAKRVRGREEVGQRGEAAQTMYAHMSK
jgi:hypothetical protein